MKQTRNHRRILAACCGAHVIQDGLVALQFVLLPILATQFGLNYSQVGLLRAVSNVAMSVLEIPAGMLAERFGERRLLAFGLILAGLGYLGVALSTDFFVIALFFFVTGAGAGFQHSLSSSVLVSTFAGASRRRALGTYNSSGDAGKLTYTGVFSLGLGAGLGWNAVVIVLAGLSILFAGVVLLWLKSAGHEKSTTEKVVDAKSGGRWGIINQSGFTVLGIVVFLDSGVQTIFLTFLAFVFLEKGSSGGLASLSVVVALTGGMIGKYFGGYLASNYGDRKAFVMLQALTVVGLVLLILLPAIPLLIVLPFIGMAVQGSSTVTYGCIADFIDVDRQARGFALIYSFATVSAVVGPFLFGFIADRAGLATAVAMLATMTLITLPLSIVLGASAQSPDRV